MGSVNAMDGIGTDPSSPLSFDGTAGAGAEGAWYGGGTFQARDAYHILGNKRTTMRSDRNRAIDILYEVGKNVGFIT